MRLLGQLLVAERRSKNNDDCEKYNSFHLALLASILFIGLYVDSINQT
jgi:hypothetical protein